MHVSIIPFEPYPSCSSPAGDLLIYLCFAIAHQQFSFIDIMVYLNL